MTQLTEDQKVQQEIDSYFKEHGQNDEHKDDVNKDVDQYFRDHHETSSEGKGNVYENSLLEPSDEDIKQQKKDEKAPDYVAPVGGVIGGYAAYKGAGTKMFKPGENVFKSAPINPITSTKPVTQEPNVQIEPNLNEPVSGLDHIETPKQNFELDPDFQSKVEEIMQSGRGKDKPTGRQMEDAQHWKSNRQSLITKHNLATVPNAPQAIIEAPNMYPTEKGIAIPESLAHEMEAEKAQKMEAEARERAKQQVLREKAEENRKALEKQKQDALKQQALEREAAEEKAEQEAEKVAQQKATKEVTTRGIEKGVAKVATGALGGALAAPDFWDFYQEYKKNGMTDEAITKMLQGLGGAAMAIPTPYTELGGAALNLGAPYLVKHFGPHNKPRADQ